MPELRLELGRYDGAAVLSYITAQSVKADKDGVHIDAPLGDDDEFSIYFDGDKDGIDDALLEATKRLMAQLGGIDDQVQISSAADCRRSGLHPRNFEGALVFVTVSRGTARLRYFGTGVNTEWDELVELRDGTWALLGSVVPDLSSRAPDVP